MNSYKTKETNTFRFKTFGDRVNDIDIRRAALYYIGHENEELPEGTDQTYFNQTIQKWNVLNLTEEYNVFSKQCTKIVTLAQLLHKKDFVIDLLLEKLSTATNLSLQPLLEILVVLGRDLREEFYNYFQRVLDRLICLLNTNDPDQLEWTLVCLAFLFKTLKPFLKRNIGIVFNAILPLLDENRYAEHVTNFSVECFAFIARDMKDYTKLRKIVLDIVEKEKVESVHGCGRLFFEIVRGVNGRFHSVAEDFLTFLFKSFVECENNKDDLLFHIVESTVDNILRSIQPHNMLLFWKSLTDSIISAVDKELIRPITFLISYVSQAIRWKDGKFLNELETMVPTILKVINQIDNAEILLQVSDVICLILLSPNAKVSQLDTSRLIKKIMSTQHRNVYESFVWNICQHSQFEILILPEYLKYFEKFFDHQSLVLLTQIVMKKSPLVRNGRNIAEWKQYPILLKKPETSAKIEANFLDFQIADSSNLERLLLITIIAPHLVTLNVDKFIAKLHQICSELCKILKDETEDLERNLFIMSIALVAIINLNGKLKQSLISEILESILSINHILAVRIINIIVTKERPQFIKNAQNLTKLQCTLSSMICSHNLEIRQLSSHSLQSIHKNSASNPYEIFYKIESIEPTVHTYREQVLLLQKLQPGGEFFKSIKEDDIKMDCLRHLMGLLYHNFKLLWDPVLKMIEEYASILSIEQFWDVYKVKLEETVLYIKGDKSDDKEIAINWLESSLLRNLVQADLQNRKKVDFSNYRIQLWKEISHFNSIREIKNRELVGMFLDFVNEEYKKNFEAKMLTWNLRENNEIADDILDSDDEEEKEHVNHNRRTSKRKDMVSGKVTLTTLITKMSVFVNQPNPKALYREPELYAFYLELLSGTNPLLRKIALDCIMSYKNKSLIPYKDHLYGLIDEKKFKDELVNFKIDKDADQIQPEHRKYLMEILLRILYGKMITKSTAKNMGSQVRKGTVLRYLSGCEKDEIFWFLKMAFDIYGQFLDNDLESIPNKVKESFNLDSVWSPRKLQGTINILELIQNQFGGLMDDEFLLYILKIIIFVGCACNDVIFAKDKVKISPKIVSIYKNVKNTALLSLVKFFNHFESFVWTKRLSEIITEVFVWDNLEKLPQDSIHSPTPLLRLLLEWGKNPKLYWLLVQEKNGIVPFRYIIDLLLNDRAKIVVRKEILELIERLLTTQSETVLDVTGIIVIQPYILDILKRLKMNFNTKTKKRGLDKRDLNILSLLTNYVEDGATCDSLLQLLLPILVTQSQNNATEEVVCQVITTLSNLIKRLHDPQPYIQKLAPLFEQMQEVNARKMLCGLITDIARLVDKSKQNVNLKATAKIVSALNAWDKRWIEQPDYDKRLDALKAVTSKLNDDTIDLDLGILVIYNCFYFIKYDKDMGMRDNASEHLKLLVPKLVHKYENSQKDVNYLVGDVLLSLVRRSIRDSNDNVRNEGINLLGEMTRKCSSSHQILKDLSVLADNDDVEVDFFENVTHLQSHRHGRALLKFCSLARTLTEIPSHKTLTQFILPLASRYLCNEKHAAKHTLIDAAVETVGVVCQLLPWSHYQTVFKFYLQKMRSSNEHQKQCVRIVVAILDAFHFDLSMADANALKEAASVQIAKAKQVNKINVESNAEKVEDVDENDEEEKDEDVQQNDEDLDSELDDLSEDDDNITLNAKAKSKRVPIFNQQTVLPTNSAKKVIQAISTVLIPTLSHSITEKSSYDNKHKLNRKRFSFEREEEEILRVPIALAMVKLLQKLPKQLLDNSLPGVFMKVCTFLKSPLKSVRMLTRDILKKIMLTLGGGYLAMLFDHMTTLLTRGFQVHVLSVTVHGVLDVLKDQLQPGDLESCLKNILEVCLNDIFGETSAEKEIEKIAAHTPEAKPSAKSYLVLHIVARNIQESCLMDILLPFKDYLAKYQSRKMVLKIQDCFQRIVTGLVENKYIARESLLIFTYGTISESITELIPGSEKHILTEKEKEKMRRSRPDCFIIPEAPRSRGGIIRKGVKSNAQANAHILVEFGLEMLHFVIKRKKLNEIGYEPFLTPLLPLLKDALKSTHIRTTTFALKCITAIWNGEYVLPAIKEFLDDIVNKIFEILHCNATFGTTKQDENFHLVKSAFKSVVALLRKCDCYEVNNDHIAQLLLYIEQDLQEGEKQPMAFTLLKAIIARQVVMPEVHDIMHKVCELSIVSESDFAKEEARTIAFTYTMEYALKTKIDTIVKFYLNQLNYSVPSGRMSAVKFLTLVAKKFPSNYLAKNAELMYLSLGQAITNEEFPDLRKAIADCLELLISKLDKDFRTKLFNMTLLFFDGNKPSVREMAALLCSRFVEQEKEAFESRLNMALPILVGRLSQSNPHAPGRFVRPLIRKDDDDADNKFENISLDESKLEAIKDQQQRSVDHELIQIQNCIIKILELCPSVLAIKEHFPTLDELAYQSQRLLGYEHEWVRINAAKSISLIIATFDFQLIGAIINKEIKIEESNLDFIYQNPQQDIKSLVLDLCAQLIPGETNEEILEDVIKIILFIANILKNVNFEPSNNEDDYRPKVNLYWLVKRLKFVAINEIAKAPHSCVLRSAIFNWIEGLITLIDVNVVEKLAPALLSLLVREMSEEDESIDPQLRQQAVRVSNKLRKRIGSELYDKGRANAQRNLMIRRANRKRQIAQQKINDPEIAAKRRKGVQERKKASKKRKTDVFRGKAEGKKKKRKINVDDMF